jgi:hypothetical protein
VLRVVGVAGHESFNKVGVVLPKISQLAHDLVVKNLKVQVDEREYLEAIRYNYRKYKRIWWVHCIDQTLNQEDHALQTYVIKLSEFKLVLSPR